MAILGIQSPDALRRSPTFREELQQITVGQMRIDVVIRELNNADPLESRIQQGMPAIAVQLPLNPQGMGLPLKSEVPFITVADQTAVLSLLRQTQRNAIPGRISR